MMHDDAAVIRLSSPLGPLWLAVEPSHDEREPDGAVCGVWFEDQRYERAGLPAHVREVCMSHALPIATGAYRWLETVWAGQDPGPRPPMHLYGTPFQHCVWNALLEIERGQVRTYGQIAADLASADGKPVAAQAVGQAVGRNRLSVLIPCHRVIGARGSLGGYAGGVARKRWLLASEGVSLTVMERTG